MTKHLEGPAWLSEFLGGIPEATLAAWRARDEGPKFYRIGRHVRYDPDEVREWVEAQARGPKGGALTRA